MNKINNEDLGSQASLATATTTVKIIRDLYMNAGVNPVYIAIAASNIYQKAGINMPLPIEMQEEKLYDNTGIVSELETEKSPWKPEYQDYYYYTDEDGDVHGTYWDDAMFDHGLLALGNCFKTKEAAAANTDAILENLGLLDE